MRPSPGPRAGPVSAGGAPNKGGPRRQTPPPPPGGGQKKGGGTKGGRGRPIARAAPVANPRVDHRKAHKSWEGAQELAGPPFAPETGTPTRFRMLRHFSVLNAAAVAIRSRRREKQDARRPVPCSPTRC